MQDESAAFLVDTHCHLNFFEFDSDRDLVLERARNNGVAWIITPGIDYETSITAIALADRHTQVYAAVGIHPNSGSVWSQESINRLRELSKSEKVVAIGEIGLDYYRDVSPHDLQKKIFQQQLELAAEINLPVIIHNRNASDDLISILEEWHRTLRKSVIELAGNPGVLHSFSGDDKLARKATALNFKIGITGPVTFKKSEDLQTLVSNISIENIVVETDSPYLSPHPFRGKRNEPANVRIVAEKIAEIKGLSIKQVAMETTLQAEMLFRRRDNF